jgi:cell division protein FtsZ
MSKSNPTEVKPEIETFAKIKVIGVGGSGGSVINRMVSAKIRGIEFIAMNTDAQALHHNQAPTKLHIGKTTTRGLGAGMDPDLGRRAAEESQDEIHDLLKGADMVFVTCGLGGGTGSGAAPVVADIARDMGALTVAVVTKPFSFEGAQRKSVGDSALSELQDKVDTIITIPNDRLLQIIDKKTSLLDAFAIVDDVLKQGVQGIADLITVPGLINLDFADVRAIMENTGSALMGIGRASGESRAVDAAKAAIDSPLLELSIDGAKGILFTVSGGADLSMYEVNEAARVITSSADPNAKVIFGSVIDETLGDEVKITVIATGFGKGARSAQPKKITAAMSSPFERPAEEPRKNAFEPVPPAQAPRPEPPAQASPSFPPAAPAPRPVNRPEPMVPEKTKQEEDLEIPAFIRKKMM